MLVRSSPSQDPTTSRGPIVRRSEWSSQQDGVQHHAQVETTHWNAPQHSYGKVVADVQMRSNGHNVQARRQVEVLSARAPGVMRVLKATITSSSTSSSMTQGLRHFDDLQLSVNPLDISSQKERTAFGRSGALGGRRPPTRGRVSHPDGSQDGSSAEDKSSLERLTSPSIVANGVSKFSRKNENATSSVDIVEVKSDSDKNSIHSDEPKYKVNFPDNESEESFYDSCPEKDSIFKDESEQLEEWRRSSKIRRSLQFPKRSSIGKPLLDIPENWGSVSRIKKELENFHNMSMKYQNPFTSLEKSVIKEEEAENASTASKESQNSEDLLIKPSSLKTKSFISLETLNEVRGKLKNLSLETEKKTILESPQQDKDDGIDTEESIAKAEDTSLDLNKKTVRSYVFGMESMLNSMNDSKINYPGGTNSLESRVSKLNTTTTRSDDWYLRRKSYGFEKVGQKTETYSLANNLKTNIESSTDSGICRSSELVNSINNGHQLNDVKKSSSRTVVNIESADKRETFEDWLQKNRKTFASKIQNVGSKYKCSNDTGHYGVINGSLSEQVPLNIPIKSEDALVETENTRQLFHRNFSEGTTLTVESSEKGFSPKCEDSLFASKRHTIAVDGLKEIKDLYDQRNDSISKTFLGFNGTFNKEESIDERKNKKVEFCKTEVHFAAESGRVNIVATDDKPPSTNNFRRRRRNSGIPAVKDEDKSKLPITHFGDNLMTPITNGVSEKPKIEQIKEAREETSNETISLSKITQTRSSEESTSLMQLNSELFDDDRRGILKNKPIKPKPYHLGEDHEIKPENQKELNNLWGVKLKPVKDSPLWKSSVLLNGESGNEVDSENEKIKDTKSLYESSSLTSVEEVSKVSKTSMTNGSIAKSIENKGYSTKVNIANGDATVQTVFHSSDKKEFVNSEDCYIGSHQRISNTILTNKSINNYKETSRENNITTKICIDVTQPTIDKSIIQNSRITDSSLFALKSTALVKDTIICRKNDTNRRHQMVLIEKQNDVSQVKTAYKSKLCELRKMYECNNNNRENNSIEGSEDSADEEVGRVMGISWSRRRALRHTNHTVNPHHHNINIHHGRGNKQESIQSKCTASGNFKATNSPLASPRNYLIMERKQNLEKSIHSSISQIEKKTSSTHLQTIERKSEEPKHEPKSIADTIGTPRALLTGRGSARKLKEHELTYFGVKEVRANETNHVVKNQTVETTQQKYKQQTNEINKNTTTNNTIQQKYRQDAFKYNKPENKQPQFIITPLKRKETNETKYQSDKHIYENVNIHKQSVNDNIKPKHPGESIIEELTKAADEILQALNGFSEEESGQHNSSDDDKRYRNSGGRSLKPLETISESNASKMLENKAVQANLPCKEKRSKHSTVITQKKTRSSSNSSLESVTKENVHTSKSYSSKSIIENTYPEKPQRKKLSSVEAVKARRLQRASSRDALLKVHGSSSEDLPTNVEETAKRKSLRRLKSGEAKKQGSSTSVNTHSSVSVIEETETGKYIKSINSILPEIRHKTAVSTIKPINEKSSSKDKSKSKTSSKDRSKRREKFQEATFSSLSRSRPLQREKSRSADTSLERPIAHPRERIKNKDTASYHGDEILESNQLKYITVHEINGHDKRKSPEIQQLTDMKQKKETYPYHRERSNDKLSSYFKKESKSKETSDHRSYEKSKKKERSQIDMISKAEPTKEKSSRRDTSHDRTKTRDSSTHRRERSSDRANNRHETEKKHEISKLRKLLGSVKESSSANATEKVRVVGGSSRKIRSTHTRTEHD